MKFNPSLLPIIVCPENKTSLRLGNFEELTQLNEKIGQGKLFDRNQNPVTESLEEVLIREDGLLGYRISGGIPILLISEGFLLSV